MVIYLYKKGGVSSMSKQPSISVALKEWAVTIDALAKGEQVMLLRKGGIHEETKDFKLQEKSFYLFPTYLHQKKELLKEDFRFLIDTLNDTVDIESKELEISYFAEVIEDIEVIDEEKLKRISTFHIWTDNFAETKLHWKKDKPIHLLMVRVYKLSESLNVKLLDEYNGCKSWIELKEKLPDVSYEPVISDEAFNRQVDTLLATINK